MIEIINKLSNSYINHFNKENIINEIKYIFDTELKNKKYIKLKDDTCGAEGFFLERIFKIQQNCRIKADYKGFEIKKKSKKITFGDWTPDAYLFNQDNFMKSFNNIKFNISRIDYMKYFGNYNTRFSWSGKCIPSYNNWNYNGTNLICDNNNNIFIIYSYKKDTRNLLIPNLFKQQEYIILQYWNSKNLEDKINNKFNQLGFIIFEKNKDNIYNKLLIGNNINFIDFIKLFKENKIIFDSGMYAENSRNYSHFRASFNIWKEFIVEEYS